MRLSAFLSLDLEQQEVEMQVADKTLKAKLTKRLDRVTFVGYVTWNAVTDSGPIEISK